MKLDVVFTPVLLDKPNLQGNLCAVVDVLRATSTIVTALASGAAAVRPCLNVAEARREAAKMGPGRALLGGEEMGQLIPGFDLGNSPLEYMSEGTVSGKTIYFYTTNGTGAIRRARAESGQPTFIAALLNVSAACAAIAEAYQSRPGKGIAVICSGRYGKPSAEDIFCAGLIAAGVASAVRCSGNTPELTDSAAVAAGFAQASIERAHDVLCSSEHGRYLQSLGFEADLEFASRLDAFNAVPVFDGERIVLMDRPTN